MFLPLEVFLSISGQENRYEKISIAYSKIGRKKNNNTVRNL